MKREATLSGASTAIDNGIRFLGDHQFHHGEFCTYIGEGDYLEKWCIPDAGNSLVAPGSVIF